MKFLAVTFLLFTVGCSPDPAPGPIIVLASFDTTRVDSISAYGGADARTPFIDALSQRGVRFDWAMSPFPTTLGSHTSMMSGLDGHGHGVPRNGSPVPKDLPLLAEKLADAGWDRIAVVGAMPLESDMGLDRGFRVYKDTEFGSWFGSPRKSADEVTASALRALDARPGGQPTFLFVHYYDPHSPFDAAPQAIRDQFVSSDFKLDGWRRDGLALMRNRVRKGKKLNPTRVDNVRKLYLAQVHWTDQQFGVLLDGLEARGLMKDSLIIMTADHGEMLDEDHLGIVYTHGPDVDLPVIHVPLIVAGKGKFETPQGQVVQRQVRLQDIANTVLNMAELPADLGNGEDLATIWSGKAGKPPAHFAEATRSGHTKKCGKAASDQWPNLNYERTILQDGLMLVRTPWKKEASSLYNVDKTQSPAENTERLVELENSLQAWDLAASNEGAQEMDPETEEALRQLGYLE